jgi:cation diffusion facilitator CzcD-associated flavoprotein CzcO
VDINETPIRRVTQKGIDTTAESFEFDLIIYATGFDAITGAFDRINITGVDGLTLREKWHDDPITYLGVQVAGFPNLFTLAGPQGASVSTNFPPAIQTAVEWSSDLIEYLQKHNCTRIEPDIDAENEWVEEVKGGYEHSLLATTQSWFTGYNSNVEGHNQLRHMIYLGGAPAYRARLAEVAGSNYQGFDIR